MKNKKRTALLVAGIAALGLAGCSSGGSAAPSASGEPQSSLAVGFVNANNLEYHTCLEKGVVAAADELGVKLDVVNSAGDPTKEQTNVEDILAQQPDILILQTVNVDSLEQAVAKANAAGVPIYLTSVLGNQDDDILGATVAQITTSAGLLAEFTNTDSAGAPVDVAIIAGAPGAASDLFVSGYSDKLDDNVNVVFNQPGFFNRAKAQEVAENLLQSNPGVQYIYVPNEEMAFGALAAVQAAGRDDIKILANGGTEAGLDAVASGDFTAMTADSAYELGHLALENAVKLKEGDTSVEKISSLAPVLVQKDNIADAPAFCG
ncbi:sugar ABC transporter substrate-binding protein [Herbiconiux ginsengi]|uniref:Ribose-binding protein n=1 Tax=Herbiconiux ginsengi TaxID=381665 RepID=A0A1H3MR06_9MICO|nr:sugar ABC transporter substrate-binding protein [Herbiconiux ginsengi]SDY78933.1 ribose-binding protein [Herbiconiux ginsengi]